MITSPRPRVAEGLDFARHVFRDCVGREPTARELLAAAHEVLDAEDADSIVHEPGPDDATEEADTEELDDPSTYEPPPIQ